MANLLLIDDHPGLLPDQVSHVFPAPAHRVEIARTGAEGLQRVADVRPDVILLDLRLPDQSGLDVLTKLRQIDARIPVVLITVVRSADAAIEAMRQGAYDYLLKPLDLQKLDRVLGEALKVARLMREPAVRSRTGCRPRHAHQSRLETAWARDLCDRRASTFFTNRAIRDHLRAFPRQAAGALRTIRPA